MAVLLSSIVVGDSGVYDDVDHFGNSIYNLTDVNSTNFYGSFVGSVTSWITMTSLQSKWLADVSNVLTFDETELNTTIDARDTDTTYTGDESYINLVSTTFTFNETILNNSIESYSYATEADLTTEENLQSANNITQATLINLKISSSDEGDLNVNSSDYWDSLGTPSDISAGDITDDGTYYDTSSNIDATGYNVTASSFIGQLTLANNVWVRALDNAGTSFINMFKVNTDDVIEAGANFSIGSISIVEDSGVISLVDMSVSSTPVAGTDEGYNFSVDGNTFLRLFGDADSAGSIANKTVWVSDDVSVKFDNGAYISVNSTCMILNSPAGTGIINVCN